MPNQIVFADDVLQAAEILREDGRAVTVRNVAEITGGGPQTVSRLLRENGLLGKHGGARRSASGEPDVTLARGARKSHSEPMDRREALKSVRAVNPELTISACAEIAWVTAKTVESWLYEPNRSPPMDALNLIYEAVRTANGVIPKDFQRLVRQYRGRAKRWGMKHRNGRDAPTFAGHRVELEHWYIYDGQDMSLGKIAEQTGKNYHMLYGRVRSAGVSIGADITAIVDRPKHASKKS